MNLVEIVEGSARAYPDRLALRLEDQRLTYAELDQTCSRAANGLERVGLEDRRQLKESSWRWGCDGSDGSALL